MCVGLRGCSLRQGNVAEPAELPADTAAAEQPPPEEPVTCVVIIGEQEVRPQCVCMQRQGWIQDGLLVCASESYTPSSVYCSPSCYSTPLQVAEECAEYLVDAEVKYVCVLAGGIHTLMAHEGSADFLLIQGELSSP